VPRIALGLSYAGQGYLGWQSQTGGNTIQDKLEAALAAFCGLPKGERVITHCSGRTDAGVHGLMQVVHFDTPLERDTSSWVRGTNSYLPPDIAVQWAQSMPVDFHSRGSAIARRYAYVLLESAVRPSVEANRVGWVHRPLSLSNMQLSAQYLLGENDFSSFRAAQCQALSPIKTMHRIDISQRGAYWRFEFEASAFLHHMIRNIMGTLLTIGHGQQAPEWMASVLAARSRKAAAPTFSPNGLYFVGPVYARHWGLPERTAAYDWLV
jgi:tRNA pseudouridine38-40 synthase